MKTERAVQRTTTGTSEDRARAQPNLRDMRLVGRQLYYEQLNFWLNPVGAVFTVGFSVVFLLLTASSAGSSLSSTLGGVKQVDYYVASFTAYGIMATCFNTLSASLVVRREMGLLKRLRLSPLPAWALLSSIFLNAAVISAIQVVLVVLIGRFAYHAVLPHNVLALVVALVVGVVSFTAVGVGVSTLIPNQEAAPPIISIVFFVLLFLSGLWYPIGPHSALAKFSNFFPVRHMILAVWAAFDPRSGVTGWSWSDILVIAIWGVVGTWFALRRWSWAPHSASAGIRSRASFRFWR
jgi:ABC-2 type transport system permease protein